MGSASGGTVVDSKDRKFDVSASPVKVLEKQSEEEGVDINEDLFDGLEDEVEEEENGDDNEDELSSGMKGVSIS